MTASPHPSNPTTRRALLTGALGGLGALAASVVGRPQPTRAADGGNVLLGKGAVAGENEATHTTWIKAVSGFADDFAFRVDGSLSDGGIRTSAIGAGLVASGEEYGVEASSVAGIGLFAQSVGSYAIQARTYSGGPAVIGTNETDGTSGALGNPASGVSGSGDLVGVYGHSIGDVTSKGVWGDTTVGHAIHGTATAGWAGYFAGRVYTGKYHEMKEITAPAAPPANRGRLFMRDNGSGKSQLCVRFSSGAIQVLATQP